MSEAFGEFVIITILLAPLLGLIVWWAYAIRKIVEEARKLEKDLEEIRRKNNPH